MSGTVGPPKRAPRKQVRCLFSLWLPDGNSSGTGRPIKLVGFTRDMSETGLALIVPSLNLGHAKLPEANRPLRVALSFATKTVEMTTAFTRYKRLEARGAESGYLLGVRIIEMSAEDLALYQKVLRGQEI